MIDELLQGLSEAEIGLLAEGSRSLELAEGDILFKPGDPASSLYIIYAGEISITTSSEGSSDQGVKLGVGDFLGEIAAIEGRAHSATATALTASKIVEVDWALLEDLMGRQPQLRRNMTRSLTERIRDTDRRMFGQVQVRAEEYQRLFGRISTVLRLSRDMNDLLDWDKLWQMLLEFCLKNLNAERGTVYLMDSNRKKLIGQVISGTGLESISLPLGHGIAGTCALEAKPALIGDAQTDPRFAPEFDAQSGFNTCAMICSPFKDAKGSIVGVVQLMNSTPNTFNSEDLDFLTLIADQFAMAREKAASATAVIEKEVSGSVLPLLLRLQKLVAAESPAPEALANREFKRVIRAFDQNLVLSAKPTRFRNFCNDLAAETEVLAPGILQIQGDTYDGFLTADSELLVSAFSMILQDAVASGATMIGLTTRDDEDSLEITLAIIPGYAAPTASSPSLRFGRKVAILHRGDLRTTATQSGGLLIIKTLALASG